MTIEKLRDACSALIEAGVVGATIEGCDIELTLSFSADPGLPAGIVDRLEAAGFSWDKEYDCWTGH